MSLFISLNCCGVSKSTTFLTSAMTDSNFMAASTHSIIGAAKDWMAIAPL